MAKAQEPQTAPSSPAVSGAGRQWAVVVGVAKYPPNGYMFRSLVSPVNDAQLFFHSLNTPPSQSFPLYSGAPFNQTPTRAHIREALAMIVSQARENDTIWFYFSGHGLAYKEGSFLLPEDVRFGDKRTYLSVTELRTTLIACKAQRKILVLDACHCGAEKSAEPDGELRWERILKPQKGLITMAACEIGQSALDMEGKDYGYGAVGSLFTHVLIEGLQGAAAKDQTQSHKGMISLPDLAEYVRREVWKRSVQKQSPVFIYSPAPAMPNSATLTISKLNGALPPIDPQAPLVAREPLKPGVIVSLQEMDAAGALDTRRPNARALERTVEARLVENSFPVLAEEQGAEFEKVLQGDRSKAAEEIRGANSRFLLRGTLRVAEQSPIVLNPDFPNIKTYRVTVTFDGELVDANGTVAIPIEQIKQTGRGGSALSAISAAINGKDTLRPLAEQIYQRIAAKLQKLLVK